MAGQRILVIEDNELNLKLINSLLEIGHYESIQATDAESGIQLAEQNHPDLILMDIQLPGMDGLSATKILKADPHLKNIPVVALTAHAMVGDEERAKKAGCDGYLAKPIDTRNFLETIAQYLNGDNGDGQKAEIRKAKHLRKKHKILIVDDDRLNVKLLSTAFCPEQFETFTAYGGEEALEKVVKESPDLILLDIKMPDLDGIEVTRRLKHNPDTKHIPIILVTGLDEKESKSKGLKAGADEFLRKPVSRVEIQTRVRSLLDLKNYREQLTSRLESKPFLLETVQHQTSCHQIGCLPTVVVVEPNEQEAQLIQAYLEQQSLHIEVYGNGRQALDRFKKGNVDLILLDILLPDIKGFEVCSFLKESEELKNVQVLIVTSLQDIESKIQFIELGIDNLLSKPIDERELKARVKALLEKKVFLDKLTENYKSALNCAIIDKLTGLYNRAYLIHFLSLETKRSKRRKDLVSLLMIDLDDFKQFNDGLGHLVGDELLREFGDLLRSSSREVDFLARYGGEEFVVVLPYTDSSGALTYAENIRKKAEVHCFSCLSSPAQKGPTLSIGIATFPCDASSVEELIHKADVALYQAKKQGKNHVCLSANCST